MSKSPRIKFRCSSCNKPLSIGRKKIGAEVTCPRCSETIIVPAENDVDESDPDDDNPFNEFVVFDDDYDQPQLIYEESDQDSLQVNHPLNERLSVPRKIVYFQGVLLGLVAIIFFLLGLLAGSSGQPLNQNGDNASIVNGTVLLPDFSADEGAVVFLFPSRARPDNQFESEELRPGRVFTNANPEVPLIRQFGGNVCTTNRAGQFEMKVEPNQEYILFVISGGLTRRDELTNEIYSAVGHYFTSLDNVTDGRACYMRKVFPLISNENLGEIMLESAG